MANYTDHERPYAVELSSETHEIYVASQRQYKQSETRISRSCGHTSTSYLEDDHTSHGYTVRPPRVPPYYSDARWPPNRTPPLPRQLAGQCLGTHSLNAERIRQGRTTIVSPSADTVSRSPSSESKWLDDDVTTASDSGPETHFPRSSPFTGNEQESPLSSFLDSSFNIFDRVNQPLTESPQHPASAVPMFITSNNIQSFAHPSTLTAPHAPTSSLVASTVPLFKSKISVVRPSQPAINIVGFQGYSAPQSNVESSNVQLTTTPNRTYQGEQPYGTRRAHEGLRHAAPPSVDGPAPPSVSHHQYSFSGDRRQQQTLASLPPLPLTSTDFLARVTILAKNIENGLAAVNGEPHWLENLADRNLMGPR